MMPPSPRELVSIRQYAASRGVSHTAVNKAVKAGKISLTDGRIDPAAADAAWERNRDSRQPSKLAADRPESISPTTAPGPAFPPSTDAAEAEWVDGPPRGSLAHWQLVFAEAKGRRAILEVEQAEGKLIDADEVRAAQTERATAEREALLNWPSSGIAADLAARFGVPERDMFLALDSEVRLYLEARSNQPLETA
jgi:hypothetical protein